MTPLTQSKSTSLLSSTAGPFAEAFGIDPPAARLLLLQTLGAVVGNSIRVTTPDMVDCTPAFDIGFINSGRVLLHGALCSALDGARREIVAASQCHGADGRRAACEKRAALLTERVRLLTAIAEVEKRQAQPEAETEMERVQKMKDRLGSGFTQAKKREAGLPQLQEELGEVERQLTDLNLVINPGIIRDQSPWRDLARAGADSFDGHFLQIATAASLLSETNSTSNSLRDWAELLQRSRSESPISGFVSGDNRVRACVNLSGTPEEFAALLRHARLTKLGLLNTFVFCEVDSDTALNVDAREEFMNSPWHDFIAQQLRLRVAGQRLDLQLDREGAKAYLEFREWCWSSNQQRPIEQRVHFLRWPELMVRIAMSLAVMDDATPSGILEAGYLQRATAMLKEHAQVQGDLLDRPASPTRLDEQIEALVDRLRRKGPQTKRDLVRGIHGQNYNIIDFRLAEATRRGFVAHSDGRYYAVDVSVNVSTELQATERQGVVAV